MCLASGVWRRKSCEFEILRGGEYIEPGDLQTVVRSRSLALQPATHHAGKRSVRPDPHDLEELGEMFLLYL
jgi:hypothetical protein